MRSIATALLLLVVSLASHGQEVVSRAVSDRLSAYFSSYHRGTINSDNPIRLTSVTADTERRTLQLTVTKTFAEQPLTKESVQAIYSDVAKLLPAPYNTFRLSILCDSAPLEEFVPLTWNDTLRTQRTWGSIEYRGNPWVTCVSRSQTFPRGLQNRHVALWASHGRYYDLVTNSWLWQRPRLFCTTEDLFTQSFVVPFLMPMLENAGAIVFTPRERDWQSQEVVVDNDYPLQGGSYSEQSGAFEWQSGGPGFSPLQDLYVDQENPFTLGTYRMADAQTSKRQQSTILWQPDIPEDGPYAVYVSYATLPTSVTDAQYTVCHRGVTTRFKVNQRMGGGTWVYLGTFDFRRGDAANNYVSLSNQSNYRGMVTADAVRLGGGMGNIARSDTLHAPLRSCLPRYLEGSRYTAQWAGMPYKIYGTKDSQNDYGEDINARSLMTNYMARGSVFLPGDSGLSVPIEMSMAIHSDAGLRTDSSIVGTLGIYTTGIYTPGDYEGLLAEGLLPSGMSRMTSRDLCDELMTSVCNDLSRSVGRWTRRQMYDKNYSETRLPQVPSCILETLSHQNWADLCLGHDPWFKFLFSRAVYKGTLRFLTHLQGRDDYVVQPLPVSALSVTLDARGDSVTLQWLPTPDSLEATAQPTYYIIYTAVGEGDFDHGQRAYRPSLTLPTSRGELMRFRVTAANEGGESLPSEELCAYAPTEGSQRMLLVNGFQRLAGPQPVDNDSLRGFDMQLDPGVVFHRSPCYCGRQVNFDKTLPRTLGESGEEYEGLLVAGNTFDYPTQRFRDLLSHRRDVAVSSCSRQALESGQLPTQGYQLIDLIFGAQRADGYSLTSAPCLTPALCRALQAADASLLVSGAYLAEDLTADSHRSEFARQTLHLRPLGDQWLTDSTCMVEGMNTQLSLLHDLNERQFSTPRASILAPEADAFCTMLYAPQGLPAAVAWQGPRRRTLTYGFPLETIAEPETRRAIVAATLDFLLPKP